MSLRSLAVRLTPHAQVRQFAMGSELSTLPPVKGVSPIEVDVHTKTPEQMIAEVRQPSRALQNSDVLYFPSQVAPIEVFGDVAICSGSIDVFHFLKLLSQFFLSFDSFLSQSSEISTVGSATHWNTFNLTPLSLMALKPASNKAFYSFMHSVQIES